MRVLHDLPDDVLIPIYSYCDVSSVLSLRLTSRANRSVIDAYIRTIAPKAARATFPACHLLLTPPPAGYSVSWLRSLIPAHLASVVLDKDKLRRYPYVNSGFPYGIPCEAGGEEARFWRARIANGWRVLAGFWEVARGVWEEGERDREGQGERGRRKRRASALRRVGGGVKDSRWWQVVACSYAECTEHGVKQLFDGGGKKKGGSGGGQCVHREVGTREGIEEIKRKEGKILRRRLLLVDKLSNQDLLDYVYLWRLLLWTFRPYRKPGTSAQQSTQDWHLHTDAPPPTWQSIISTTTQGYSWLNWCILHLGPTPFLHQWSLTPNQHEHQPPPQEHHIRTAIWSTWASRTPHRIEIERSHIAKLEFAVRRRCLSPERLSRLEAEMSRGRCIRTISLDCIPWAYDQHPMIVRGPGSFPWYDDEEEKREGEGGVVWMQGGVWLRTGRGVGGGWARPGGLKMSLVTRGDVECGGGGDGHRDGHNGIALSPKGPLERVPYLVYLGVEDAAETWGASAGAGAEFAF